MISLLDSLLEVIEKLRPFARRSTLIWVNCLEDIFLDFLFSTFYTVKTLRKPKDRVATEDKNNIIHEIDSSNCQAVSFSESKRSLKLRSDEHKRSVRNCECYKNATTKHCWEAYYNFNWDQKKIIDRESRLILRKIKETMHSLKNPNHINKISYMLPEI